MSFRVDFEITVPKFTEIQVYIFKKKIRAIGENYTSC